jgi:hypothetical protein
MQKNFISSRAQNTLLSLSFTAVTIIIMTFPTYSQLAPVNPPSGGFRIDGDLKAGTPTANEGDWLSGTSGGFVFNNEGTLVNGSNSRLIRDAYNTSGDDVFSGSSFSQNPNSWRWATASAANKTDIHNGMYHIASDGSHKWVIMGGDREVNTGTSYIDFEFYQGYFTKNSNGSFSSLSKDSTSLSATGGRTVGDFVLSMEYTNGGALATVHYYRWELSSGSYRYVEYNLPSGSSGSLAFGATNTTSINTPLGAFGNNTYSPYLFVEAAVDVDALLNAINPCAQISIKSVFIKTKASDSYNAALKDFISPIPVDFVFGRETFDYPEGPFYNCGSITPSFSGTGSFGVSPAGLSINASSGLINLSTSTPGTYVITYSYDAGGGCNIPTTDTITVMALPAPGKISNQILCSGSATSAVNFSSTLTPVSFSWTNNQTSIGLSGSGIGNIASFTATNDGSSAVTSTINYTPNYTTNGATCAGPSDYFTIKVNPLPSSAQVRITEPKICGPATGTVTVTSPLGTGYMYKNNGGEWQSDTVFAGITAGAGYHILVKDDYGCISSLETNCEEATTSGQQEKTNNQSNKSVETTITNTITLAENIGTNINVRAFPNPFQSRIVFEVKAEQESEGTLELFTIMGQKIMTVYSGKINKGVQFFYANIPTGTHQLIYTLKTVNEKVSGRMMKQ